MRCEDFLPWLESGGAQAEAARRHAAECESCRKAAEMLQRVKAELAVTDQMPAAMRAAMLGVADGEVLTEAGRPGRQATTLPSVERRSLRPMWFAVIAASILIAATGVWWQLSNGVKVARPGNGQTAPQIRTAEVRRVGPITVATIDPGRELAALASELAALEQTLAVAMKGAERLAVEQALERVLTNYQRTFAARE